MPLESGWRANELSWMGTTLLRKGITGSDKWSQIFIETGKASQSPREIPCLDMPFNRDNPLSKSMFHNCLQTKASDCSINICIHLVAFMFWSFLCQPKPRELCEEEANLLSTWALQFWISITVQLDHFLFGTGEIRNQTEINMQAWFLSGAVLLIIIFYDFIRL